ncbi:hypothetical protein AM501_24125 [Aneurinibacillus migulanus]|uniref:hypothetical protein n=1 Tax=Aneurinibacillus migulanus TaxID=47500 RepID=UPI0005BAA0C8|nr:hypothetical protein [Aneurinibacillus migulanus]KIV58905.1 hypothetical protein TS64_03855 [Aneurinibacillus migulanus]KPD05863.1 hypothetical protein AM501_24125 [Aneurinibacillus migulanus]
MAKRYRKTILNEYQTLTGAGGDPCAGHFREEIGDFIISYHLANGKIPSFTEIVENCIPKCDLNSLDPLYDAYQKLEKGEITQQEYEKVAEELAD